MVWGPPQGRNVDGGTVIGTDAYMTKPFIPATLLNRTHDLLSGRSTS
jgi:DNA-binding response OmpR family regulator